MMYEVQNQLSVSIEDAPGALASVSDTLAQHDVSISAVSINDNGSQGSLRFTASDPLAAKRCLEAAGYPVSINEVLSIRLKDSKGKLASLTKALSESGVNIDYMYASVDEEGGASRLILKVSNIHMAARILDELRAAA